MSGASWRAGLATGVSACLIVRTLQLWRFNLSASLNLTHLLERLLFSIIPPPYSLKESDQKGIEWFRWLYRVVFIRPVVAVKRVAEINISSSKGHVIPATVIYPDSQLVAEKCPIIIYM